MLKSLSQRQKILLASLLAGLLLLLLLFNNGAQAQRSQGSTYSRTPTGYGAWYAYLQDQGISIQRWQKPASQLSDQPQPITLVRVQPTLIERTLSETLPEAKWLAKGNRLIVLGVRAPATNAPFHNRLTSDQGLVRIDTRRRWGAKVDTLLEDQYGAIIQRQSHGQGELIWVVTPYLAANAYQDSPGNFQLLAKLANTPGYTLWIDEYIHGYKDAETLAQEVGETVWAYLQKTPLLFLFLQGLVLLMIALWAGNQRFGSALSPRPPRLNNNLAYIEALATVLEKAESTDFVARYLQLDALDSNPSTLPRRNEALARFLSPPPKP
ncbi:DUF4350 domain-containing protein [Synechocystis sp. LKSZ1]|uniref:DUF4350 domain-containing protein n=1 Tax=Synechocystis sp. LKSZ1 TaxID=3144951 RepID=UPI00336BDF55